MDKWEQLVADRMAGKQVYSAGYPYTRQFGEIFLAALRQCEADTIRRCAEVCEAKANHWGTLTDDAINNALNDAAASILALLPQESDQ